MKTNISMSSREHSAVLCALRCLQEEMQEDAAGAGGRFDYDTPLGDILTNGGEDAPLCIDEINELCERLNRAN